MSGLLTAQPRRVSLQILVDPLTVLVLNLNLNPDIIFLDILLGQGLGLALQLDQ